MVLPPSSVVVGFLIIFFPWFVLCVWLWGFCYLFVSWFVLFIFFLFSERDRGKILSTTSKSWPGGLLGMT